MKVGKRTILLSETLFVPDGEVIEFEHMLAVDDILQVRISFRQDESSTNEKVASVESQFNNNWFEISFINFNASLGATISHPFEFGLSNKKEPLSLLASVYRLTNKSKIEFQIMMEVQS